ncbi:hypothetical protein BT96DRAFT_814681 [Gymnopus androsaceus JB14]|uniref:Uncharacterized protein n=1 Tax=Gymnopus androsaceus JB14 TaxID=1447944 RepID=A0A6A4I041_9AGAR|nr:hypothetical protein BT96DRAFT_814681 [Gymnopus androsaceus JB14]
MVKKNVRCRHGRGRNSVKAKSTSSAHSDPSIHSIPSQPFTFQSPLKPPLAPKVASHVKSHAHRASKHCRVDAVGYRVPAKHLERIVEQAAPVSTSLDTDRMHAYTSGYIGKERVAPRAADHTWSLNELVSPNSTFQFTLIPAEISRPIVDASQCVFGAVIPPPRAAGGSGGPDPTFLAATDECAKLLECNQSKLFKHRDGTPKTPRKHCQGIFAVEAVGVSFGGGQEYPKRIYHSEAHAKILNAFLAALCFIWLAQHASSGFFTWAPRLYAYYAQNKTCVEQENPGIHWNFARSIFACCTFNFGPQTVTVEHLDHLNYLFGWCAITALGKFNYCQGGHFVLWDLGLVVELPPGWTILVPSAYLCHSNTIIRVHETCYSFTQYTAGGLFRIVDNDGQIRHWMSEVELAEAKQKQRDRVLEGMNLYSTLDELRRA